MIHKAKYIKQTEMRKSSDLVIILQRGMSDKFVTKYINNNNFQRQAFKSPVLHFISVPYHLLTYQIPVIRRPKRNNVARRYKRI